MKPRLVLDSAVVLALIGLIWQGGQLYSQFQDVKAEAEAAAKARTAIAVRLQRLEDKVGISGRVEVDAPEPPAVVLPNP